MACAAAEVRATVQSAFSKSLVLIDRKSVTRLNLFLCSGSRQKASRTSLSANKTANRFARDKMTLMVRVEELAVNEKEKYAGDGVGRGLAREFRLGG